MYAAPYVELSGHVAPLSGGAAGLHETLAAMRAMVNASRVDLTVRQTATNLIFMHPQRSDLSEVEALFSFVRDSIRYVRDVHGVETLTTPAKTLQARIGDCDDKSTLLAALLESVGYPTRFVVTGYTIPGQLEHVYLQAFADGQWVDLDPTEPGPVGYAPPDPVTVYIETVE